MSSKLRARGRGLASAPPLTRCKTSDVADSSSLFIQYIDTVFTVGEDDEVLEMDGSVVAQQWECTQCPQIW